MVTALAPPSHTARKPLKNLADVTVKVVSWPIHEKSLKKHYRSDGFADHNTRSPFAVLEFARTWAATRIGDRPPLGAESECAKQYMHMKALLTDL